MSEARDRIEASLHNFDEKRYDRVHVFVRKEDMNGESLDRMLQDYVQAGWYIKVRQVKSQMSGSSAIGLTFCKNPKFHQGNNPNFV